MGQPLPVDAIIPDLLQQLQHQSTLIIQAPPGAGKTTRIPLALRTAFPDTGRIIMLEPRRLAAVNAARWMAATINEEVGQSVGYSIRFERRVSPATKIEVVTEGLLTRRLQADPELTGVGIVLFDEFHERSIHADTALAFCREIQAGLRPDLKLIVMSATLDTGPLVKMLGHAPVLTVTVPSHPVEVRYLQSDQQDVAWRTAAGIARAWAETSGDILVFLPGSGEIRRCASLIAEQAPHLASSQIVPLYGDLPFAEQQRAMVPSGQRRVILATNIAETSLTIAGVRVVVDSGQERHLQYDAGRGLNRLVTGRISAASATQRAGRAGRLGPGVCYRLWPEAQQQHLLPFAVPEICRVDLAELCLQLALWGMADPAQLSWLDPPPAGPVREAQRLLQQLGALDTERRITPIGRVMAALPTQPRLARMLVQAASWGVTKLAGDIAALLTERDPLRRTGHFSDVAKSASDLQDRLTLLSDWRRSGRPAAGADSGALAAVQRAAAQLVRSCPAYDAKDPPDDEPVSRLLLLAYPDRVARQREPGSDRYLLANGSGGVLSRHSAVREAIYLIAVTCAAVPGRSDILIHYAHAITEELLRAACSDQIRRVRVVVWDDDAGRVRAEERELLGDLQLGFRQVAAAPEEVGQALMGALQRDPQLEYLPWSPATRQFCQRVELLRQQQPEAWPDFSMAGLVAELPSWLGGFIGGVRNLAGLGRVDLLAALKGRLTWQQQRTLDEQAPVRMTVPSGSSVSVEYQADGPPILAVKLQEMFGLAETPRIAWGRQPLLLHLLSPAGRPLQITSDLRTFWDAVYPEVKRELKGRYPKHPWPDDPWSATPTRKTNRALQR